MGLAHGDLAFPAGFGHKRGNPLLDLLALAFRAGHLDLSMFGDALDDGELFITLPALIFVCGHFNPPFLVTEYQTYACCPSPVGTVAMLLCS